MGLKDLPVLPCNTTDKVQTTYVKELHAVTNAEQLKAHVERWLPLFKLEVDSPRWAQIKDPQGWVRSYKTKRSYLDIIEGKANYEEAWQCIKKGRVPLGSKAMEGDVCEHAPHFSCPGMHIAIPLPCLHALMVSQHYGVTTDLALIQANGGYGAFEASDG